MRVLHVITRLILGGAQENTLTTAEDLIRDFGDDVLLATGPADGPEGDLFEQARKGQVPVEVVAELRRAVRPITDVRGYVAIRRLLRRYRPEVLHTHSSKAGILGRAAGHDCQIPAIVHTIHGLPFHPFERWWRNSMYLVAERWAAKRCHRIISVADAMTEQALAAGVGRPNQFVTIHSGMEVEAFLNPRRGREEVRRELGLLPEHVVVVKVARLFELKGHDDVIDAAREVLGSAPLVRFVFVGGGPWRERLEGKIRSLGLESAFRFTGLVGPERIPELLGAGDIVVHASYREGLARVLPQALIAGRPVVSYDVDGAREVALPDQTGYLVPPKDIGGLARAIVELASDPWKRSRYGETGRAMFVDAFRHETMTRRIRGVYEEVLGGVDTTPTSH